MHNFLLELTVETFNVIQKLSVLVKYSKFTAKTFPKVISWFPLKGIEAFLLPLS